MTLEAGHDLLHYRLIEKIGEGGMGEVYEAEDTRLRRPVALKVLASGMVGNEHLLQRFQREAQALAAMNHPNIVTIHSVEQDGDVHFITMELVRGHALNRLMPEDGMALEHLFEIALPIADALSAAHDRGITHRDLKPGNVMVGDDRRARILDFGLAKLDTLTHDTQLTRTEPLTQIGSVLGTMPYMSPEQVEGKPVDHRTDVFSFGVMLYEMATGKRPFHGESSAALVSAILRDSPVMVNALREELPRHLGRIVGRCIEKDPRDRYQTARDIYNELRALRREVGADTPVSAAAPAAAPTSRPGADIDSRSDLSVKPWIAVLPFTNASNDSELDNLADGLSEDVATGLSKFPVLFVVAQQSTQRFKAEKMDVRKVGEELGARFLVEGSIRKSDKKVRVSVQVVDSTTGTRLWSERYDRNLEAESLFDIQDDIADHAVATIADTNGVLIRAMAEPAMRKPAEALEPYEASLLMCVYSQHITPAEHLRVRTALEHAIERDPHDATCLANLAITRLDEFQLSMNVRPDAIETATTLAHAAVSIDPTNHLAHQAQAFASFCRRDIGALLNAAGRAVALNPRSSYTLAHMGLLTAYCGEWERGVELVRRAIDLNPHHPGWYHFVTCNYHLHKGQYREALAEAQKINMPGTYHTHVVLGAAHSKLGNKDEARNAVTNLLRLYPDFADKGREEYEKWFGPGGMTELTLEALREAGLSE